jgi:endonuclease YncB( thermonuclease family)
MVRAGLSLLLALAAPQPATVLSIGDGDTLRLRQGARTLTVRLACIDAPEIDQAPWGQQARQQLQTLAPIGSAVTLRSKATDRYGRQVAELSRKGRNLNQALVASGAAFVYWPYIQGCDRQTYGRLETEARLQRLGVWSTPGGITRPWDVRRARRTGSSSAANTPVTTPGGRRYRCSEIGSHALAQALLRQGHSYLDRDGDGEACESLS